MKTISQLTSLSAAAAAVLVLCLAGSALGQEAYLDTLNKRPREYKTDQRSENTLLPALAKLQEPPVEVRADFEAGPAWILMDPSVTSRWEKAKAWEMAESQQAAIKALRDAIRKDDKVEPRRGFGLSYGATADAREAVKLDLYADLGDENPTIAEAKLKYLPRLQWLEQLVHVHASRLVAEGKCGEAVNSLIDLTYLGRQMTDRELFDEVKFGMRVMTTGLSRIRDVLFVDYMGDRKITQDELKAIIPILQEDGMLGIGRIRLPGGEQVAIDQMIARAYGSGEQADATKVGPMMATVASRGFPLRIFNESARWAAAASSLGTKSEMQAQLKDVWGDWSARWALETFSNRLRATPSYALLNKNKYAIVALLPDMNELFDMRLMLQAEAVGTRYAIGHLGYFYQHKSYGRTIISPRPDWIKSKEADPFNPQDRALGGEYPPYFLRPMTADTKNQPLSIKVITGTGYNFDISLRDDVWVIYSVGSDNSDSGGRRYQNTYKRAAADYLIWPPVDSLTRKYLKDSGSLK